MAGGVLLLNAERIQSVSLLFMWMSLLESNCSQKHICTELKCMLYWKRNLAEIPPEWNLSHSITPPNVYRVTIEQRGQKDVPAILTECFEHIAHHLSGFFIPQTFTSLLWTWATELIKNFKARSTSLHQLWKRFSKLPSSYCKLIYWFLVNSHQWVEVRSLEQVQEEAIRNFIKA